MSPKSADISVRDITDALDTAGTVSDYIGDNMLDHIGNAMLGIVVGGFKERQVKEEVEVTEQECHQSFYSGIPSSDWKDPDWDSSWD